MSTAIHDSGGHLMLGTPSSNKTTKHGSLANDDLEKLVKFHKKLSRNIFSAQLSNVVRGCYIVNCSQIPCYVY